MTKKLRLERAKAIIDQYSIGEKFNDQHHEEFEDLTGFAFDWIQRVPEPPGCTPARHLACSCPEWDNHVGTFSWRDAVNRFKEPQLKQLHINRAMRKAVQPDQKAWLLKQEKMCAACLSTENLQADHKDIPFIKIQSSFADQFCEPEVYYDPKLAWKIKNEQQWIGYHNSVATYQVLCRSCNASKGAR